MIDWIFVVAGLALLVVGGDWLVKGAVAAAFKLGISALVVSLTVVAFGTSAPELLIGIESAIDGVPELAVGNVVGSNTANVLLVIGLPALLYGLNMQNCRSQRNYIYMIIASVLFIALAWIGPLTWWHGLIMIAALAAILWLTYSHAMQSRELQKELESEVEDTHLPNKKIAMFLALGLVALPIGAALLIKGSVSIARDFGVSEAVIGLTLVAVGTSLPELATTLMAAYRKQTDVVVGNVIGSNIFNVLAILGITALVAPLPVPPQFFTLDLPLMLGASLIIAPFVIWRWNFNRIWGAIFVTAYVSYIWLLLS